MAQLAAIRQPDIYIAYISVVLVANELVHTRASFFVSRWPISPADKPIDKTREKKKLEEREREKKERSERMESWIVR